MEQAKDYKKIFAFIAVVVSALAAIPVIFGGVQKLSCKRHGNALEETAE